MHRRLHPSHRGQPVSADLTPIDRLGEFPMPHLCSPTLLFLRRITPSRRHMSASPRLAAGPCVMGLGALVRSPALVPCVPRWPCRLAAAAPRGQGRCRPPLLPACRRRWCGKGQLAGGRGRGGRRRGRGGGRGGRCRGRGGRCRGEASTEAGVAGAGTEREERVERKELTGGPHCHVSVKPTSKTAGWSIMNGFHTWMVKNIRFWSLMAKIKLRR